MAADWHLGEPTSWCDEPPAPQREVVEGVLRRGSVTLLVGPEGSGKSMTALALAVAVVRGETWLGRKTERGSVLYLDEENATAETLERGFGLGLRGADRDALRHYSPRGTQLADASCAAAVEAAIADLQPVLVVVDGGVSAGGVDDANSNSDVARLYTRALIPWARRHDLAVLLLHHPSKAAAHDDDAALGAGAWRRLAAAHFVQRQAQPHYEATMTPSGGIVERYRHTLASTSKVRWGPGAGWRQEVVVESERAADGAMRWLRVDGAAPAEKRDRRTQTDERIVAVLRGAGRALSTADLAQELDLQVSGSLRGRLAQLARTGRIARNGDGWAAA